MAVGVDNRRIGQQRKPLVFIQTIVENSDYIYFPQINQQREEEEWWYTKGILSKLKISSIFRIWMLILVFRLLNGWIVKSFFDPDEYWQSMEVAHNFSFGYGYLTWEWSEQIRGTLHPLIFTGLYEIVRVIGWDSAWIVQWLPRFFQATLLSIQDILTFILALRLFPSKYPPKASAPFFLSPSLSIANWTLLCSLCDWFNWYCGVRTYSNTMEGFVILLGILFWPFSPILQVHWLSYNFPIKLKYYWKSVPTLLPYHRQHLQSLLALFFAGFSCVIRPTAAILWILLFLLFILSPSPFSPSTPSSRVITKWDFFIDCIIMGGIWIGLSCGLDRVVYGQWVVVPWEFVKFNILQDIGSYYGTHPFHWYFSSALPTIFFSLLPLLLLGLYLTFRSQFCVNFNDEYDEEGEEEIEDIDGDALMADDGDDMIIDDDDDDDHSHVDHSPNHRSDVSQDPSHHHHHHHHHVDDSQAEFANFGGPITYLICSSILVLSFIGHKEFRFLYPLLPLSFPFCGLAAHYLLNHFHRVPLLQSRKSKKRLLLLAIILPNIPMICYFSLFHQVGGNSAMEYFQTHPIDDFANPIESIYFLMPCHSTPYYSFLHRNISMQFLDCSPPIKNNHINNNTLPHVTEQSTFYANPTAFLDSKFLQKRGDLPTHFVVYDRLLSHHGVPQFFNSIGYSECKRFFHTYTPLDDAHGYNVLVYCKKV